MTLRTFRASDGTNWTIWLVDTTVRAVAGSPKTWLAFQNEEGTERRRLFEIPEGWEELDDDRIDLLRKVAEPVKTWTRLSPPGGVEKVDEVRRG